MDQSVQSASKQAKTIALFKFIKALNQSNHQTVLNVSGYRWYRPLSIFLQDPENIHFFESGLGLREEVNTDNLILSVHKPEPIRCPAPDASFQSWLKPDWESYKTKADVQDFILHPLEKVLPTQSALPMDFSRINEETGTYKEYFQDQPLRREQYEAWTKKRQAWADKEILHAQTRNIFLDLYRIKTDLEREPETLELIAANGFLKDKRQPSIHHPILTRRVGIRYDAEANTIYIEDLDIDSELYTALFHDMEDVDLSSVNQMNELLQQNNYHPLDSNETPGFFKIFIHKLSPEGFYSDHGVPEKWEDKERLLLYSNPSFILRKRMDGSIKAIEQIIENVEQTGEVPNPIRDLVEGGKITIADEVHLLSIEEQLAAVGGESVDILLSKEANREQLEIARRIERYNAVLVQGPPGTGKTHTIANLLGHLLAQGKSVLITSHTRKALQVLKEKVAPGLRNLCVAMLEDSNRDMEKSIDGIADYLGRYTSFELKQEMDNLGEERKTIISDLAEVRRKIYAIIHQEADYIVYNGESLSPSQAANFVLQNRDTLDYIPGTVRPYAILPLSAEELADLYQSNVQLSAEDEQELSNHLPDPQSLLDPSTLEEKHAALASLSLYLQNLTEQNGWKIQNLPTEQKIILCIGTNTLDIPYPDRQAIERLKDLAAHMEQSEPWMKHCAADGKQGGSYKDLWNRLIAKIQETRKLSDMYVAERLETPVQILSTDADYMADIQQLRDRYQQKGKLKKLDIFFNPGLKKALDGARVGGHSPQTPEECDLVLHTLKLEKVRGQCAVYWNDLMGKYQMPLFADLDPATPERIASNYIPVIQTFLNWYQVDFSRLKEQLTVIGIPDNLIFQLHPLDSDTDIVEKVLTAARTTIPALCDLLTTACSIAEIKHLLRQNKVKLTAENLQHSEICRSLLLALDQNSEAYRNAFEKLQQTYAKYDLKQNREQYLQRLRPVAPEWAEAIQKRIGMHGNSTVPQKIEDAWKWKQYDTIVRDITSQPYTELQKKSLSLSQEYRRLTAAFAEKSAWYHLLQRTEHDISMKQNLIGWKQTVKKIGKGTGKNAPFYRAEARKLMAKCQNAVPAWIMPINKALESLNPRNNHFDVVIIDEASQSDISSLAILYMGKKLIIVGDDKQVSPLGIGTDTEKIHSLKQMYLNNVIPNAHLYDAKTSIYDLAATTFQPLMLREHFRCVPDIIGFSNFLSYDYKIKPLRDESSSNLFPAVVNYRVSNGERIGKTNPAEAKAIVALMRACMEQPEYQGKTFGIISLLGDEQVKILQTELDRHIDPQESTNRHILCGNAANFQGDERDVIFLSLVDCANDGGPVSKQGDGQDDAYKKRYNVAASRARDQLWVVDSLDPSTDLKPGDIRKLLIEYSLNPKAFLNQNGEIESKADSPFEVEVTRHLAAKGYHLVQQWPVGAYRLDMAVLCGNRKMAIECDGERYHSGEDKIRADMERQTILERLGWRFIRIRGSEYYRNPAQTMERVIQELSAFGIEPEEGEWDQKTSVHDTELLQRVKARAQALLEMENSPISQMTIAVALNFKEDVMSNSRKTVVESKTVHSPVPAVAKHSKKEAETASPGLQQILPGMGKFSTNQPKENIIDLLRSANIPYIDNRSKNGSLWIIGGKELCAITEKARKLGVIFHYKADGGKATKNQPGWWAK